MKNQLISFIFLTLVFVFISPLINAQNELIKPLNRQSNMDENEQLKRVQGNDMFHRSRLVNIDTSAFTQKSILANLFPDINIPLAQKDIGRTGVDLKSWSGRDDKSLASGSFIFTGKRISGHVVSEKGNFEILPVGNDGTHIIVEYHEKSFGGCGNEKDDIHEHEIQSPAPKTGLEKSNQSINRSQTSQTGVECFVRVMVAYTTKAKDSTEYYYGRTMLEHVSLAIVDMNQGYANSLAEMRVELAFLTITNDNETTNSFADVQALQNPSDGPWDYLHAQRAAYNADMVCLMTGGLYPGNCGRAYGFDYTDPSNMFQVTEYNCAVGNFSMAHEFGHTQGARHDNDFTGVPFFYARGYNDQANFRTIMAVCCFPQRVNYWSTPLVNFPSSNTPVGTINQWNAGALNVGDYDVAHHELTPFGPDNGQQLTVGERDALIFDAIDHINSFNVVNPGAKLELRAQNYIDLFETTFPIGFWAKDGSDVLIHIQEGCNLND